MKKRVTAELISIAHRILKLKSHSDTLQLQQEVKKLYDQLTILRFYEENFESLKTEISPEVLADKLEGKPTEVFNAPLQEKFEAITNEISQPEVKEEKIVIAELILEEEDDDEVPFDKVEDVKIMNEPVLEIPKSDDPVFKEIKFEDFAEYDYNDLDFIKVEKVVNVVEKTFENVKETPKIVEKEVKTYYQKLTHEPKISSLNDKLNKSITFGLNDRIGFEKKLFGGSTDDFNRVISQLNTFDSFDEAKEFIEHFVKPDYNYWVNKEEFEVRFMEIVEKKFN